MPCASPRGVMPARTLDHPQADQPLRRPAARHRHSAGLEELTNREREAVALAAHGLSNDEIAERMVISPTTAKTHVNRAMMKVHARTAHSSWSSPTNPAS